MPETNCGFADGPGGPGANLLMNYGPTISVNIGFDPNYKLGTIPESGIKNISALVDSGASICCIDNLLAAELKLPIVDRMNIAGSNGSHSANLYLAQIYVPSLAFTMYGSFAGVDLKSGGQPHHVLMGRTFLQYFKMIYEGKTGAVTLTR